MSDTLGESVLNIVEAIVPMYMIMGMGYISAAMGYIDLSGYKGLASFLVRFSLPAMICKAVGSTNIYDIDTSIIFCMLMFTAVCLLMSIFIPIAYKYLVRGEYHALPWIITCTNVLAWNNAMIVGMPVVFSMYGQDAIEIQTIITALQVILMVSLIVPMYEFNAALNEKRAIMRNESNPLMDFSVTIVEKESSIDFNDTKVEDTDVPSIRKIMKRIGVAMFYNTTLWACAAGLAWSLLWYKVAPEKPAPSILVLYLGWLSDTVHALAFFNIGFFMHSQKMIPERNLLFQILGLLILKFVVAPMVMFLSAYVTGVGELAHHTIVVQSFIPSASILFAFAEHYDVMPELMAPVVLYGALLSLPASLFGYLIVEAVLPDLV